MFPSPPLILPSPCQLYADDLVVLTASQTDLQLALDAVHAWGVRWRFSFGVGPTKSATMVFGPLRGRPDCCVHIGGVQVLGRCPFPSLSWRPHVDFLCSEGIVFSTRPVLGALVKVSLSPSCLPLSLLMFSQVPLLVLSSLLTILLPSCDSLP